MNEKFDQNTEKNTQKTVISDTGSGILAENQKNSTEISKSKDENATDSCKVRENTPNLEKNAENIGKICENKPKSGNDKQANGKTVQESYENQHTNKKISKESTIFLSKTNDLSNFYNETSESELKNAFPAVNIENLRENKEFNSLLSAIMKSPSLSDIYACYNAIISQSEENSRLKLAQALANAEAGVGALASKEGGNSAYFTKEQVLKMSPDQIRQNFQQIRESQGKW